MEQQEWPGGPVIIDLDWHFLPSCMWDPKTPETQRVHSSIAEQRQKPSA